MNTTTGKIKSFVPSMQKLGSKWWSFQLQLRDGKFGGVQM